MQRNNTIEENLFREANSCCVREEIPCILWNVMVHYCVQKTLLLALILIQLLPYHPFSVLFILMFSSICVFPAGAVYAFFSLQITTVFLKLHNAAC